MILLKAAPVLLLTLIVAAEKKIELQDIEEDNLKSEKETQFEKIEAQAKSAGSTSAGLSPLDFLKSGLFRYFESPVQGQGSQQTRYVQQYAVSEPPEKPPTAEPKSQYGPPTGSQQAMVGYLSNVPMQIYLVPQHYNEQEQANNLQSSIQYTAPASVPHVPSIPSAPESVQTHTNYIEVPAYVTPTGKAYIPQYPTQVAYVTYAQPSPTPQATVSPVVAYQLPLVQYPTAIVAPPVIQKDYYQGNRYTETNSVDDAPNQEHSKYPTQGEVPYVKSEFPRYYNSRIPVREEYKHGPSSELPPPNQLLLKPSPPHLSHIPKALPMYRPLNKPVYATSGSLISNAYTPRPGFSYGAPYGHPNAVPYAPSNAVSYAPSNTAPYAHSTAVPYKRRPTSLLDSYIPSSLQVEYLKRGYNKDPLQVYEALSNHRHYPQSQVIPRYYERGFLPNQMYHTGGGGVTYGHYKRTPKLEKVSQK